MENMRFKPKIDKLFWIITLPTMALMLGLTVFAVLSPPIVLVWMLPVDIFVAYFLVSPLFGYAELRENSLFIKYGFILKKEIPYEKIRGAVLGRGFYAESMMSLKNSFEHVNIKYNRFDVTVVSVTDNAQLISELEKRIYK